MSDAIKNPKKRTFEAGAHSLEGVQLKAIDDQDLDRILGRGKSSPHARHGEAMPLTQEVILKLIALLKAL